jgi:predicted HNH restriction endonuclease
MAISTTNRAFNKYMKTLASEEPIKPILWIGAAFHSRHFQVTSFRIHISDIGGVRENPPQKRCEEIAAHNFFPYLPSRASKLYL